MPSGKINSFEQAIAALDRAAKQQPPTHPLSSLGKVISMQSNFKDKAHQMQEEFAKTVHQAREKVVDVTKHAAKSVDTEAHRNPWAFVGIAAFLAAVIGFFLGRKSKD